MVRIRTLMCGVAQTQDHFPVAQFVVVLLPQTPPKGAWYVPDVRRGPHA
jgi:hypothetical protein